MTALTERSAGSAGHSQNVLSGVAPRRTLVPTFVVNHATGLPRSVLMGLAGTSRQPWPAPRSILGLALRRGSLYPPAIHTSKTTGSSYRETARGAPGIGPPSSE
jgi:hypothetical protein